MLALVGSVLVLSLLLLLLLFSVSPIHFSSNTGRLVHSRMVSHCCVVRMCYRKAILTGFCLDVWGFFGQRGECLHQSFYVRQTLTHMICMLLLLLFTNCLIFATSPFRRSHAASGTKKKKDEKRKCYETSLTH